MIGMELGEPLPGDMLKWSDIDNHKAAETIRNIRELGWEQQDIRGANFERLKNLPMAMIDFKSTIRVLPANNSS